MWWFDWKIFGVLCALAVTIWIAIRPTRDPWDDDDVDHACELYDGKRPPKVTLAASIDHDADGFPICTRCKASAYAAELCLDNECPTTLMMARLGIAREPSYEELQQTVADLRQQLYDMTQSRDEYYAMNAKNLRTATAAVANPSSPA